MLRGFAKSLALQLAYSMARLMKVGRKMQLVNSILRLFESDNKKNLRDYCTSLLVEKDFGYEERLQNLYQKLLKKGDFAVDIGAHSGRHAFPLANTVGDKGRVVAFEVQDNLAQHILYTATNYDLKNISVEIFALSNYIGESEFTIATDRLEESGLKARSSYNGATETELIKVSVKTLDVYDFNDLKFIKIDTEGAEYDVLKGSKETIIRNSPVIAFEFGESSYNAYGVDPLETFDFFTRLNYQVLSIFGDILERDSFGEASREQKYWDYVACLKDDLVVVQSILKNYQKI